MSEANHKGIARVMAIAAFVVLLGLMTLLFGDLLERQRNPNQQPQTIGSPIENPAVRLLRNKFGHYVATGSINGEPVEFLLDTGATDVSVPPGVARRAGLERGIAHSVSTANGIVTVYSTVLDEVALGPITQYNVDANINPHMNVDAVLLGMSFLKRVTFTQRGEHLILQLP